MGFGGIFGAGTKTFGGKVHPFLEMRVFRHLWSRSDSPYSSILYGYSHFAISENLGKFGGPQLLYQKSYEYSAASRHPLDLRLSHWKIGIILRCNSWAVGWSPEGTLLGVLYGENGPKSENWATLGPRSSATVHSTKSWSGLENSLPLGYNAE